MADDKYTLDGGKRGSGDILYYELLHKEEIVSLFVNRMTDAVRKFEDSKHFPIEECTYNQGGNYYGKH